MGEAALHSLQLVFGLRLGFLSAVLRCGDGSLCFGISITLCLAGCALGLGGCRLGASSRLVQEPGGLGLGFLQYLSLGLRGGDEGPLHSILGIGQVLASLLSGLQCQAETRDLAFVILEDLDDPDPVQLDLVRIETSSGLREPSIRSLLGGN